MNLTPRQRDVASLVARGATNKDIAAELGLTHATVKLYLHRMYARLGICGAGDFRVRLALLVLSQVYE